MHDYCFVSTGNLDQIPYWHTHGRCYGSPIRAIKVSDLQLELVLGGIEITGIGLQKHIFEMENSEVH